MIRITISIALFSIILGFNSCQKENAAPDNKQTPEEMVKLKVNVKLLVGDFLYENIEAPIEVKAFDASNNEKWSSIFAFSGPTENELSIVGGYDHYTISLEKWGVNDNQSLTGKQLSDNRADGPSPVTYVLGGKVPQVKKPVLTYQYTGGADNFLVQSRTEYHYNNVGKVDRITYYENYLNDSTSQLPTRYQVFEYLQLGDKLSKLTTYWASNDKISEDTYEYGIDGSLIKITEANYSASLTSTMNLTFDASFKQAKASYQYSNGRGFDYEFAYDHKNLISDKTTEGAEVCNQGTYTYDRNINPFKHLGYTSYLVAPDYSINNRLTENVNYINCGFPVLMPESYSYKYDDLGYPIEKITHYKGTTLTTATKYYYQIFPQ